MKFRKKPVVVEAWRNTISGEPVPEWLVHGPAWIRGVRLRIVTLEGTMIAEEGDWIIRGIAGEIYPCKQDIFEATYEPA